MNGTAALDAFLQTQAAVALVDVASAKGSTPRDEDAWMLVSAETTFGTIGGGQLEFMAIDKAREMLGAPSPFPMRRGSPEGRGGGRARPGAIRDPALRADLPGRDIGPARPSDPHKGEGEAAHLDIPLGPEIGQCCGGRVEVTVRILDHQSTADLIARVESEERSQPHIYLFGGGHVGNALAAALALLPLRTLLVETRAGALAGVPVETRLTAMPEQVAREAPPGSAFVVLTHDHALDFLIVAEALRRGDAAYVGMIGSATKKATFRSWFFREAGGSEAQFAQLTCPIGAKLADKRPPVIAALAAAEVLSALLKVK